MAHELIAEPNCRLAPKQLLLAVTGIIVWVILYKSLEPFSRFLVYTIFNLERGTHLADAVQFFIYDTPKVLMLLTLIVFIVGIITKRAYGS